MLTWLQGKKTYVALAIGALIVLANKFLGVEIPGVDLDPNNWLTSLWALVTGGAIRAGITKSGI